MVKDGSALARATSIGLRAATSLKSLQMRLVAFLATARRPAGRCRINAIEPEVAQFNASTNTSTARIELLGERQYGVRSRRAHSGDPRRSVMHGIHATALAILGANKECGARRVRCFLLGTFKTCRDAPDVRLKELADDQIDANNPKRPLTYHTERQSSGHRDKRGILALIPRAYTSTSCA